MIGVRQQTANRPTPAQLAAVAHVEALLRDWHRDRTQPVRTAS